ncbi:MAG: glycoside hydrolase family 5 protein, partial [Pseudomonadota bacterium]
KAVSAGGSADFGVEIKGDARFDPRHATVVEAGGTPGVEVATPLSPPPLDAAEAGAPPADVALPSTPSAAPASPQQSTSAAPSGVATHAPIDGPLSTSGRAITDETGQPVDIYGVNWFGFETDVYTVHGLWARNWKGMMDEIVSMGFNTIRVPFSGDLVASGGGEPSGINASLNPSLTGLNGLQILDKIVAYADEIGLSIILDYHRGEAGNGPNANGLWYGGNRTEADVIAEWEAMAARYSSAPAVIGADLINEPFNATWGDGTATDWAAAAERIGNAVHTYAPHWLILVEGISVYDGDPYWWGGNLQGVKERPVTLEVPHKVVYSPHDYPASVHPQPWFTNGSDLTAKFRQNWGFIAEENIAPVVVGEWGSRLQTDEDQVWASAITNYMKAQDISWLWWALNPNSADTGGVLEDDWVTKRPQVLELMEPFLTQTRAEHPNPTSEAAATDTAMLLPLGLGGGIISPIADAAVTYTDAGQRDNHTARTLGGEDAAHERDRALLDTASPRARPQGEGAGAREVAPYQVLAPEGFHAHATAPTVTILEADDLAFAASALAAGAVTFPDPEAAQGPSLVQDTMVPAGAHHQAMPFAHVQSIMAPWEGALTSVKIGSGPDTPKTNASTGAATAVGVRLSSKAAPTGDDGQPAQAGEANALPAATGAPLFDDGLIAKDGGFLVPADTPNAPDDAMVTEGAEALGEAGPAAQTAVADLAITLQ